MSFPPTATDVDGIRRRPTILSFLSFRSTPAEDVPSAVVSPTFSPSPSEFFDKMGNGSTNGQPRFYNGQISFLEAAKSRLGKTIAIGLFVVVSVLVLLSPGSPISKLFGGKGNSRFNYF